MKPSRFLSPRILATLVLGCALTQPSCALLGSPGPSDVSQGRLYQSGHSDFDPLFAKVHALQLALGKAPGQEEQIRIALARELELELEEAEAVTPAASPKRTSGRAAPSSASGMLGGFGASLKQTALGAVPGGAMVDSLQQNAAGISKSVNQLQQSASGISKSVDPLKPDVRAADAQPAGSPDSASAQRPKRPLAPAVAALAEAVEKKQAAAQPQMLELLADRTSDEEVVARVHVATKPIRPDSADLARAVEQAVNDGLRLRRRMQTTNEQLKRLLTQLRAADVHVDLHFRKGGPRKRAEVRKNLNDAASMIQAMLKRAEDVEVRADELIRALQKAAQAPAASQGAIVAKGTQAPRRKAPAKTKRVASRTKAAARKEPPVKATDDFEP